jgi:hypothetical protein
VDIEVQESPVGENVLLGEIPEERTLAAAGLSEHGNMRRTPDTTEGDTLSRHLAVFYAEPEIDTSYIGPCSAPPSGKAIPNSCDELFEQGNEHGSIVTGGLVLLVTTARTQKNPRGRNVRPPMGRMRG